MLQRIRDGASGPLAYVVVGVITLVFGVWGIGSYFTPSSDPVVASAAGTDITHSQLQNAFDQRYQRIRQMFGDNFDPDLMPPAQIRRNVLDGLVGQAVMQGYAADTGYRVSDASLLAQLRSDPQFQDNGQFSAERYRALLAQANISPAQYEASLRGGLMNQQVQQIVAAGAFAAPAEVDQAYKLANQQRDTRYLVFDPAAFRGDVNISAGEIEQYYKQNADQFQRPQRVKLSYVSLDAGSVSAPEPDAGALKALYEQKKSSLGSPETRSAEVVRVAIDPKDDAASREAIQKVAAAVKSGDSLSEAANKVQSASLQKLSDQSKTDTSPALGNALFDLDKGGLSNPIRGDDAWYLGRVTTITPASTPAFDTPAVQAELKAMARRTASADAFSKKAKALDDLAYQAPNDLQTIAKQLNLDIQQSDWLNAAGGPGIGQYDAVRKAAFSDAVLKDKLNSEVVDLGEQRKVVLRVEDKQPAELKPLAEVRNDIRDTLVAKQAGKQAQSAANAALAKAKAGTTLAALAQGDKHVSLENAGFVGRSDSRIDPRVLSVAFAMPLPGKDKSSYSVTPMDSGDIALVAVDGARDSASGDQQDKEQRTQFAQQQSQANAQLEYAALDSYLRSQADVDIRKDALR